MCEDRANKQTCGEVPGMSPNASPCPPSEASRLEPAPCFRGIKLQMVTDGSRIWAAGAVRSALLPMFLHNDQLVGGGLGKRPCYLGSPCWSGAGSGSSPGHWVLKACRCDETSLSKGIKATCESKQFRCKSPWNLLESPNFTR